MKLQEKLRKEVPAKKISETSKKFAKKVDEFRAAMKKTPVSLSAAVISARRKK